MITNKKWFKEKRNFNQRKNKFQFGNLVAVQKRIQAAILSFLHSHCFINLQQSKQSHIWKRSASSRILVIRLQEFLLFYGASGSLIQKKSDLWTSSINQTTPWKKYRKNCRCFDRKSESVSHFWRGIKIFTVEGFFKRKITWRDLHLN